ncbi:Chaperone protein HtpG [Pontiella desulfatans]|uniref:Chaperone protein HtpG n=1 Tax=Pontiella desulfatans TaxID=2750659 RepID=A0A6C2U4N3_PONDE|nr:molecular chaperone HtpG [Pontiella desulfatans]VGO15012.1 Chaperone protein HtpG [Pontiella desulfatans]
MAEETMQFKTELEQLLHLITHSLYSHREVFLRELISNACDAIDKVRFEGLNNEEILEGHSDWKIFIKADEEAKTLTISDNGIGMSRDQVIENLGTIAHSGTKAFLAKAKEADLANNPELIGQFGVGFYASFMVADDVTVVTKAHGEDAVKWESKGTGSFTLSDADKADRGTEITLHLKEDAAEYLNEWTIKSTVKKFSDFLEHPVVMCTTKKDEETEVEEEIEEQINTQKAIWLRPKSEITDEEYGEFYKHISHDTNSPAETIHYNAEGAIEFKALLFIPEHKPFDMMMNNDPKAHLNLYVQRVFISNEFDNLLPGYLRFVKGVVDSSDLPLNVSREILQENPMLDKIRKNLTSRILKTLANMKKTDYEEFQIFHENFSAILKEGLQTDWENKEKIAELLLFESTAKDAGEKTCFDDYVERMAEGQEEILYLAGENRASIENSPYLEKFKADGKEVLLMIDPIDDFVIPQLFEFKGKKLKAVNKGDIEEDKEKLKEEEKQFEGFIGFAKELLDGVKEVKLTTRLKDSAAVLVGDEYSMSPHIEEMMRRMGQEVPPRESVLELNPEHAVVKKVQALYDTDQKDPKVATLTKLLHDQAVIASGAKLTDPAGFAARLNEVLAD